MFAKRAAPPMAIVVCSLMLAAPASAQHASGAPRQTATTAGDNERRHDGESAHPAPDSSHHRMLYAMMKDMSAEMKRMTDQMSQGEPTSGQRKQIRECAACRRRPVKNPHAVFAACAAAVLFASGCSKNGDPPTPKVVQAAPVTVPQLTSSAPTLRAPSLPEPNASKDADGSPPHPGQNNDTSSPEFKNGGAPDPHE